MLDEFLVATIEDLVEFLRRRRFELPLNSTRKLEFLIERDE